MLNDNAKLVLEDRYSIDSETWEGVCRRLGHGVAKAERPEDQSKHVEEFSEVIHDLLFLPGGRTFRGVGRPNANLLSCFVLDIDDTMRAIRETFGWMWEISAEGGGVGINFSKIRPSGAELKRKGGVASGPVSFMSVFDKGAEVICSGAGRRAALKGDLNISHPDILKFISAKLDHNQLNNFNISVGISRGFLNAVKKGEPWELVYGGKVYETVDAQELWARIMEYAVRCGEPGLIHMDNICVNNSWYFAPVISTNPCGELPLEGFGSCCLGHINLSRFVTEGGRTKWQEMEKTIKTATRFLDNVLDINHYFLEECRGAAGRGRRTAVGVMGLADYFFKKEIRYGSEKSIEELDNLFAYIRNVSYASSIELAKERGAFPAFNRDLYCEAKFIRRLPRHLQRKIYENGIRNVTLNTCAPTGTVHQLAGTTSGIEPLHDRAYWRNDKIGRRPIIHETYAEHLKGEEQRHGKKTKKKGKLPKWFVGAFDITPFEHLEVQATIQRYNDGAIAKTIMCPAGTTAEELSKYLLRYIGDLKGATVYVDKSRDPQILDRMTEEEAIECIKKGTKGSEGGDQECIAGVCDA